MLRDRDLLHEIHYLEAFCAKNSNLGLQEDEVERLRWNEKVSVFPKPVGFGSTEAKARRESRCYFGPVIDLVDHRLNDVEVAFELEAIGINTQHSTPSSKSTYTLLFHVNNECTSMEVSNAEVVNIFRPIQLLWCLWSLTALRRRGHQCFNVICEERLM